MINRLKSQGGYSLVEVLAAIVILSIAIIPMVGMFDAGLRAVSTSGNFDKARTQATQELENIRALPYYQTEPTGEMDSVRELYRPVNGPFSASPVPCRSTPLPRGIDTCTVRTAFVSMGAAGSSAISEDPDARNMMSVQVTATWDSGSYTTTGLISQETR